SRHELVHVERRLLVRMRLAQRRDHLVVALRRIDRLEPKLRHALLATRPSYARLRPRTAEKRPRSFRVPRAVLVIADPPGASAEQRLPKRVEGLPGDEDDELAHHAPQATADGGAARAWPARPTRRRCASQRAPGCTQSRSRPGASRATGRTCASAYRW